MNPPNFNNLNISADDVGGVGGALFSVIVDGNGKGLRRGIAQFVCGLLAAHFWTGFVCTKIGLSNPDARTAAAFSIGFAGMIIGTKFLKLIKNYKLPALPRFRWVKDDDNATD